MAVRSIGSAPKSTIISSASFPGTENSLGYVKINFPNKDAVYMHDTPLKSLFGRAVRFESSGCVRVQHVDTLVDLDPADTAGWNISRMMAMKQTGEQIDVKLVQAGPGLFHLYQRLGHCLTAACNSVPTSTITTARPTRPPPTDRDNPIPCLTRLGWSHRRAGAGSTHVLGVAGARPTTCGRASQIPKVRAALQLSARQTRSLARAGRFELKEQLAMTASDARRAETRGSGFLHPASEGR